MEGLKTERSVLHLVLSPMPPQTIVERAEELACQVRGVRSLVRRHEEEEAQRVKSIDDAADQDLQHGGVSGECGNPECACAPEPTDGEVVIEQVSQ